MKTDLVLTIDEYLDQGCVVPKRLSPPGRDARHISITADSSVEAHSCRCDRWGHPLLGSSGITAGERAGVGDFGGV